MRFGSALLPDILDYGNPVAQHPLNEGLVSWWLQLPLNRGSSRLLDLTRRNHGTLTNGPTWQGARGRPGGWGAINQLAGNQYVLVSRTDLIFPSETDGTLAFWWRKVDTTGRTAVNAARVEEDFDASARVLVTTNYGGGFVIFDWGGWDEGSTRVSTSWSADTAWHHWCYTVGGGLGMRIYRDGVLVASNSATPFRTVDTRDFQIGNFIGSYGDLADHDDWRAYSLALSATEVAALYDESRAGYPRCLRRVRRAAWSAPAAPGGFQPAWAAGCNVLIQPGVF